MDELGLFTAALGLGGPGRVARTEFDAQQTRLDLYLEFDRGARFPVPSRAVRMTLARCTTPRTRRGGIWTSSSTGRWCMPGGRGCAAPSMGCGR